MRRKCPGGGGGKGGRQVFLAEEAVHCKGWEVTECISVLGHLGTRVQLEGVLGVGEWAVRS